MVYGACDHILLGTPKNDMASIPTAEEYATALTDLDMTLVKADMALLLKDSKDCWPADGGNYGPFMIRLAWHCAGTYRASDDVGGCGGGRQRFEPERSWPDNANLDKARALLYPLKEKYGDALSWGDLFILAGTVAYEQAGAPISKMCFGRVDQANGEDSSPLGEACTKQGNCEEPWGSTTVGLIYVNPGGALVNGEIVSDPVRSVAEIRRTFGTMGHSDNSTVALIGGGHSVGKCHGACPSSGGNAPDVAFRDGTEIWKGECGTGKGPDTVTSGFEGYWTTNPYTWDNEFFIDLLGETWTQHTGAGGQPQYETADKSTIRLVSDMALLEDPAYRSIVETFATNMDAFNAAFDKAWFDLTTTNVGGAWSSAKKCTDGSVPPERQMRMDEGPSVVV